MDQSTVAAVVYQAETGAIMHFLYGLLAIACVVLLASLGIIINLRIKLHVKDDELVAARAVIASIENDRDSQRLRRRKSDQTLAEYHARVAPLVATVEAIGAAPDAATKDTAVSEARRLVRLVPRERKKS